MQNDSETLPPKKISMPKDFKRVFPMQELALG